MIIWFVTISFGILTVSAISYSIVWRKQEWQEQNMVTTIKTLEEQARAFRLKPPKYEFNCMVDDVADAAWVAMLEQIDDKDKDKGDENYFAMKASIRDVLRKYMVDYQ